MRLSLPMKPPKPTLLETFQRAIKLIFQASPSELCLLIGLTFLVGVAPSASLFLNKVIIDEVSRLLAQGTIIDSLTLHQSVLFWSILGIIILSLVTDALSTITNFIVCSLRDRLQGHTEAIILSKVSYFADIELFENPQLLNLVQLTEKSKTSLKELAFIIMTSLRGIFVLIPTVILAGTIALWIPLLLLISAFPSVYVDLKYRKKTWDIEESQVTQARQMKIYREVLMDEKYAKELRLLNLQELFLGRWNSLFKSVFSGLQKTRSQGTFLIIFWSFFSGLGIILPYIYIILGTLNNTYTLGDLALYAGLILQIRRSLFSLINDTSDLYAVVLDIRPLFQVLDIQPKLTTKSAITPSEQGTRGIKIENLSFTYPNSDRTILEDISLEIKPQEIIALVGENGEGKTTLIKLLCRLYDADAGNIFWNGRNLKEIPFNELRSQITTVMQDYVGFPVSIRENIEFGDLSILPDEATIKKVLTQVGLAEIITELPAGLDTLLGKELEVGIELSQGQLQRLAIARALLRLPKTQLLILDEPTASLDPNTEYEIYDIFRSILADKMGLIITHRLALCHLADRIILLESGKILEEGDHEQLMQLEGKYYQMFTRQASSYLEQSPTNC